MITISLKVDENMLKNMDLCLRNNNYGTRTEFIRSAIREKMEKIQKQKAIYKIMKYFGKGKNITDKELEKIGEQAFNNLLMKRGLD